ncbi:hypothetical protein NDU88_007634 [Pleurodeles waltl]|uniref:Uncharacterized protein n=1 Tax=Pleurodeles waltl TaxID=8319 RepID=A0AAV7U222_PLEWA|nr:hypothetical protein NDU88_007634 [Pleurodeles waltl]
MTAPSRHLPGLPRRCPGALTPHAEKMGLFSVREGAASAGGGRPDFTEEWQKDDLHFHCPNKIALRCVFTQGEHRRVSLATAGSHRRSASRYGVEAAGATGVPRSAHSAALQTGRGSLVSDAKELSRLRRSGKLDWSRLFFPYVISGK